MYVLRPRKRMGHKKGRAVAKFFSEAMVKPDDLKQSSSDANNRSTIYVDITRLIGHSFVWSFFRSENLISFIRDY